MTEGLGAVKEATPARDINQDICANVFDQFNGLRYF